MEKLNKLIQNCKGNVDLYINNHRGYYETVEQHLKQATDADDFANIGVDVYLKMIELDTIIELIYYHNTPVAFNRIFHYDLEKAVDVALANLNIK